MIFRYKRYRHQSYGKKHMEKPVIDSHGDREMEPNNGNNGANMELIRREIYLK